MDTRAASASPPALKKTKELQLAEADYSWRSRLLNFITGILLVPIRLFVRRICGQPFGCSPFRIRSH